MEFKIKPSVNNTYPFGGLLVHGHNIVHWLLEIQRMELSLSSIQVYPIPDTAPNSVWGCLIELDVTKYKLAIGQNTYCQLVHHLLYIPEKAELLPRVSIIEMDRVLKQNKHIYHPVFGLVMLPEPLNWEELIALPSQTPVQTRTPSDSVFIPHQIKSFQVVPITLEDVIKNMEEKQFPQHEKLKNKPLNPLEKAKLFFYQQVFKKGKPGENNVNANPSKGPLLSALDSMRRIFSKKEGSFADDWKEDYEDLEKRNQKQLDKLLDLFKTNPEEALKYAIPLDRDGVTRGTDKGLFEMNKRWLDFSIFSSSHSNHGSGSTVFADDGFLRLQAQYNKTAEELIKQGEYFKAAFIYLKLLKNPSKAAQTLEEGKLYQEAASLYLKQCNNKAKAAECYEKGNMTLEAIELYKELNDDEKVGDLYMTLHKKEEAFLHYTKLADGYQINRKYVKASLVYKHKMNNPTACQHLLMQGWRENSDASNCLNNYFSNIEDVKTRGHEIEKTYANEVTPQNIESYLQVIKHEYSKHNELSDKVKDIGYEIIVKQSSTNPSIVSELRFFNKKDQELFKDTMRYKLNRRTLK